MYGERLVKGFGCTLENKAIDKCVLNEIVLCMWLVLFLKKGERGNL